MSSTIAKYGNTSSASIPISLVEKIEAGKIQDDDIIVMVGFGAAEQWALIRFNGGNKIPLTVDDYDVRLFINGNKKTIKYE